MKNKDLKKQLIDESKDFIPDLKDKIYASVGYKENKPKAKINLRLKPALMVLVLFIVSLSLLIKPAIITNSFVVIQINPFIELEVNQNNKIVVANPLNTDGYFLLENLDLSNLSLEEGVDLILTEATLQGYLQTDESKISAYVINPNTKVENNLNATLKRSIDAKIPNAFDNDEELKIQAKKNKVSPGRMLIINSAKRMDSNLTTKAALNLENRDLIAIINQEASKQIKRFENQYKDNLFELDNRYNKNVEDLEKRRVEVDQQLINIKRLIANGLSYQKTITKIANDFLEYPLDVKVNYEIDNLIIDIEDFYNDYFIFLKEVLEENHQNQRESYRNKVKENSKTGRDDFSIEHHDNLSPKEYNRRYTDMEKEVIRKINKISILIKNRHFGNDKKIEDLYNDYLDEIKNVSFEFRNSEIVTQFEAEYSEYNQKNKHNGR